MEHVVVVNNVLIAEVEHQGRIQGYATEACLEMQVRTRATASVATQSDRIAGTYLLIFCDELLRHVTIDGLKTVVVADDHVLTITTTFIANNANLTREGCADRVTNIDLDVDTLVLASPACTEVRGHQTIIGRHAEILQRNTERIRQRSLVVGVFIAPVLIEVFSWRIVIFCIDNML